MRYAVYASGSFVNRATIASDTGGVGFLSGPGTLVNDGAIGAGRGAGVRLAAGGRVTNHAGAVIRSSDDAIRMAAGMVSNAGLIAGGLDGISASGGAVVNAAGGEIVGGANGVAIATASARVCNAGTILGGFGAAAIALAGGGSVRNAGYVGAFVGGVGVSLSGAGVVTNTGRIDAHLGGGGGVAMPAGTLRNAGTIVAAGDGVVFGGAGTVVNGAGGFINGGSDYAGIIGATSIVNAGTINAGVGVDLPAGGTLTNAGLIGGYVSVWFGPGTAGRLIVDPGGAFGSAVVGGGAGCALELAAGSGAVGTIGGLGSQITGFGEVMIDAGAIWLAAGSNRLDPGTSLAIDGVLRVAGSFADRGAVMLAGRLLTEAAARVQLAGGLAMQAGSSLAASARGAVEIGSRGAAAAGQVTVDRGFSIAGAGTLHGEVIDDGRLLAAGGTLQVLGGVSGGGGVLISPDAVFGVSGALSVSRISFLPAAHATAALGQPTATSSVFAGFRPSDAIDLRGFRADGLAFAEGVLTVHEAGGGAAALHFAGAFTTASFAFAADGHGGTTILHA